jgi:uncharacterized surface protein with fasciclin (FAS1) repeats
MKNTNRSSLKVVVGAFGLIAALMSAIAMAGDHGKKMGSSKDIVETAIEAKNFSTLLTAVKQAGLVDALKGDGPYTLFAPTDEAFAKIPKDKLQALLNNKEALTSVLTYHVIPANVTSGQVVNLTSAKTLQGQSISIDASNGVKVDNANVIKTDIVASNGVIHVIDTVIMPN